MKLLAEKLSAEQRFAQSRSGGRHPLPALRFGGVPTPLHLLELRNRKPRGRAELADHAEFASLRAGAVPRRPIFQ